jgi:hypothetical protein
MNLTPAFNPFPAINAPEPEYNPDIPRFAMVSRNIATTPRFWVHQLQYTPIASSPRKVRASGRDRGVKIWVNDILVVPLYSRIELES